MLFGIRKTTRRSRIQSSIIIIFVTCIIIVPYLDKQHVLSINCERTCDCCCRCCCICGGGGIRSGGVARSTGMISRIDQHQQWHYGTIARTHALAHACPNARRDDDVFASPALWHSAAIYNHAI